MSRSASAIASLFARRRREIGGRARLAWLLGLLLVMQMVGTAGHHHAHHDGAPTAELAAAIGHAVPICLNDERQGPSPVDHDDDRCGACCLMGADLALVAIGASLEHPTTAIAIVAMASAREDAIGLARHAGGSSPRGPPPLV